MPVTLDENGNPIPDNTATPPAVNPYAALTPGSGPNQSPLAGMPPDLQASLSRSAANLISSDAATRAAQTPAIAPPGHQLDENGNVVPETTPVFKRHWWDLKVPGSSGQNYAQMMSGVEQGVPGSATGMTKLGKLLYILKGMGTGAIVGSTQPTLGTGFEAAQAQNMQQRQFQQEQQLRQLQTETARQNLKYLPLERAWQLRQMQDQENLRNAQIGYYGAGVGLRNAQADATSGYKQDLAEAQEEAAHYKTDPNLGLIDLRTQKPVDPSGQATLSAAEADALGGATAGHQEGERVSLKVKNSANQMANRGIHTVTANGHVYSVNNNMEMLKDWGTATPVVTMNMQLGSAGNPNSPAFQDAVDQVGQNKINLQTAVAGLRRYPGAEFDFMSALRKKYPNYFQGNYEAEAALQRAMTSGTYSQKLNNINTAREHATVLTQLAERLDNGDVRAFNALGNAIDVEFGNDPVTNFNIAKQLYSGEVGAAIAAGGGTQGERDEAANNINSKNSWKQLAGALKVYDSMLAGKQKAIRNTYNLGMEGQPNFGQTPAGGGANPPAPNPPAGGGAARKKPGDIIYQGTQKFKVSAVDKNGKPTAADPVH